ncbi:PREDICTED: coiled-coil domain-containing protein 112-like [Nicrophorus vespilloides]|uniref:Coiled-coil domain-containing protein 112-like n=1 Tax=Nicrophorus vespilloides TaxID=110193 RepID=A0ABM1M1P7_NICVS|nr:PREDICTED: coiled-coil domain-containing protein 112-like [Nicrophorus vespilloides]
MISSFVSQANKLKNVQIYLEHSLKNCGASFDDDNSICHLRELLSSDRFKECHDFRLSIFNIAESLNSLKLEVFNGKTLDLKQLKADLISIQERSRTANAEAVTKLRLLSEQENMLTEEVFSLQQRMCEWSNNRNEHQVPKLEKKKPIKEASAKVPAKEVQTFANFLQKSGGHENGWRVKDHSVFLKLRKKYRERGKMIAAVRSIFPDMSERDVEEHEEWYLQYSKLQSEQNDALKRWKEEQQNCRLAKEEDVVVVSEKSRKAIVPLDDPRDVKERLLLWKEEKKRRQLDQLQLRNDLDERLRQMENSKKIKCEEAKLEIAKWKREKELQTNRDAHLKIVEKQRIEDLRCDTTHPK